MPIPLGILAVAGFRPSAAGAFQLIESTTLGSNTASVTFSSLGSTTYQHLQLRMAVRTTSGSEDYLYLRFNSDTGTNYRTHYLEANGTSVLQAGTELAGQAFIGVSASAQQASNIFSGFVTDILDPFETSKNTTIRTLGGYSTRSIGLVSGLWMNTNALTSITLKPSGSANFLAGSRFSLYGIRG